MYLIFVPYRIKWLDFPLSDKLFLYLHTLQFARAQKTEGRCDIFGTYTAVIMFTFFVLNVPLASTRSRRWKKIVLSSRGNIQIRYTTYVYMHCMYIYDRNNLFIDIKLGIFLLSTKVNSLVWNYDNWIMIKIFFLHEVDQKCVPIWYKRKEKKYDVYIPVIASQYLRWEFISEFFKMTQRRRRGNVRNGKNGGKR